MNRPAVSSIGMKRTRFFLSGSRMKRLSAVGRRSSADISTPSFRLRSCSAMEKPRLGMNGNGCAGSIDSGVSTGKTCSRKCSSSQASSSLVSWSAVINSMPFLAQQHHQVGQALLLVLLEPFDLAQQLLELLLRRAAVGALFIDAFADLAGEPGHANHEELVEIGSRDRQEAHPFEQRMACILQFLQHAAVELQPGELAVDETVRIARDTAAIGAFHCREFAFNRPQFVHGAQLSPGSGPLPANLPPDRLLRQFDFTLLAKKVDMIHTLGLPAGPIEDGA